MRRISIEKLLRKKWFTREDPEYGIIPLMAVSYWDCWICGKRAVAKSRIGVYNRVLAHIDREHPRSIEKEARE